MDLSRQLPEMSWRRFTVLLRGLRPESSWGHALRHEREKPIDDPVQAERVFDRLMG